ADAAAAIVDLQGAGCAGSRGSRASRRVRGVSSLVASNLSQEAPLEGSDGPAARACTPLRQQRPPSRTASPSLGRWVSKTSGGASAGAGPGGAGEEPQQDSNEVEVVEGGSGTGVPVITPAPVYDKKGERVAGSIGRPPRPSAKPPTKSPRVAKKGPAKKKAALNKPGVDENGNPVDREKKFPRPLVEQEKIALLKSIEAVGGVKAYASKGCSETSYLWWETNMLQGVIAALRDDETYHDDPKVIFGSIKFFSAIYDWVGSQKTQLGRYL
ncbi:unnamed protein product, partial [Pylaiella littoralis]